MKTQRLVNFNFFLITLTHRVLKAADTEHTLTTSQGSSHGLKRKAGERSESFDDGDNTRPTKIAKYVVLHFLVSGN